MLAAPLSMLFEDASNDTWVKATGTMKGNGFGWGQFSHTFAWVFKVTGLTPTKVYAVCGKSKTSGADIHDALVVTCTNGATISATGVGTSAGSAKLCGNWIFGTEGSELGPEFEFEHLSQSGTGPGSMDALVNACLGKSYNVAAGAGEGLKAVATIDAMYRSALSGLPEDVEGCGSL
jgi:predicted dehydrogenase